jgi:hypothetical protein
MSNDSHQVLRVIANNGQPMSTALIREKCPALSASRVNSAIGNNFRAGRLVRTGFCRVYMYSLSTDLQELAAANGTEEMLLCSVQQRGSLEIPKPAIAPVWPAISGRHVLRPMICAPLPWAGEEELPPVIAARYCDALAPRPRDD